MKTIWSLQIKQDLGLGTLVLINCLLLPTNWWGFEDFNKVWREALLLKLNQNGISGNFLKLLRNFISSRKQRVVLNGQYSSWDNATAGVPQGSALRSSLILIYINDLSDDLSWNCQLFADDTSLFSVVNNIHTKATTLSQDVPMEYDF